MSISAPTWRPVTKLPLAFCFCCYAYYVITTLPAGPASITSVLSTCPGQSVEGLHAEKCRIHTSYKYVPWQHYAKIRSLQIDIYYESREGFFYPSVGGNGDGLLSLTSTLHRLWLPGKMTSLQIDSSSCVMKLLTMLASC